MSLFRSYSFGIRFRLRFTVAAGIGILVGSLFNYSISNAAILVVGSNEKYHSIQTAITLCHTNDTIRVLTGVYREGNIIIDKAITLQGAGRPVLDGEHKCEVVSVTADNVVIEGIKVVNSGRTGTNDMAGIKMYNAHHVILRNNILDDNLFGIYAQYCTGCTIEGNQIKAYGTSEQLSGNGIHCWKSDSMQIIGNNITGHRDGIYFEFVTASIIWRNQSHGNIRYGLHFMFSHNDSYVSNIFQKNGAGVAVMYTHGIRMYNNFFEDSWGESAYGLLLKEITDSHIDGNHFTRNTIGIHMEGCTRIVMQKNVFGNDGYAIRIQGSCDDNELYRNDFIGNTFDVGTNSSLSRNHFDYNYWDKYEGYDLARDGVGDIPFHPVSLFSTIVENNPSAMMLFRSFMATLMDKTEKVLPAITPEGLKDEHPMMKRNMSGN